MGVYVLEVFEIITYFNFDISLLRIMIASLVLPQFIDFSDISLDKIMSLT